jgi:hypothetical protein
MTTKSITKKPNKRKKQDSARQADKMSDDPGYQTEERIIGGQKVGVKVYRYNRPSDEDQSEVVQSISTTTVRKLFYVE